MSIGAENYRGGYEDVERPIAPTTGNEQQGNNSGSRESLAATFDTEPQSPIGKQNPEVYKGEVEKMVPREATLVAALDETEQEFTLNLNVEATKMMNEHLTILGIPPKIRLKATQWMREESPDQVMYGLSKHSSTDISLAKPNTAQQNTEAVAGASLRPLIRMTPREISNGIKVNNVDVRGAEGSFSLSANLATNLEQLEIVAKYSVVNTSKTVEFFGQFAMDYQLDGEDSVGGSFTGNVAAHF